MKNNIIDVAPYITGYQTEEKEHRKYDPGMPTGLNYALAMLEWIFTIAIGMGAMFLLYVLIAAFLQ